MIPLYSNNTVHVTVFSTEEANLCPEWYKLGVVFVVEVIQDSHVLTVAQQPVNGREVLTLGQLLVQSPEHLHGQGEQSGVSCTGHH